MEAGLPKADDPKRRRRWYQFRLRTLLIAVAIVAIPCAWLGSRIERKRNQQQTVDMFREYGGGIRFDYQQPSGAGTANGPAWLRSLLGENVFSEVIEVHFIGASDLVQGTGGKVTDEVLKKIESLSEVKTLHLTMTPKITDAGIASVSRLKKLNYLAIGGTQVTNAGLANLKELPQLEHLFLGGNRISDSGLENLKGLSTLRELGLHEEAVTDEGLATVESLSSLEYLMLGGPRITDAGLEHLKGLKRLKKLSFNGTKVTNEGVAGLRRTLPNCTIAIYYPL
jgi:Leucine-rich repeat (LRR) protein